MAATNASRREGDSLPHAVDVQFPWESHPRRSHARVLEMPPLHVDRFPVTNTRYKDFLAASGWRPERSSHNWLRH